MLILCFIGQERMINTHYPPKNQAFIGRTQELELLQSIGEGREARMLIVYGRRRIGKTELIEQAYRERNLIKLEGLEGEDEEYQRRALADQIARYTNTRHGRFRTESWRDIFELIVPIVAEGKWTLYFEEVQWIAHYRGTFASELKYYWDNFFRNNQDLVVVLCGSSPSFMLRDIARSKALYNRSQHVLHLGELYFHEARKFLKIDRRDAKHALNAYLTVGGIPEYLKYLRGDESLYLALCNNSFKSLSFFSEEWEKVFVSSLGDNPDYRKVIEFLSHAKFLTRNEILQKLEFSSGGRLTELLTDLEECGFIERYVPYSAKPTSKLVRYAIADNYLHYYLRFIKPNLQSIMRGDYNDRPSELLSISEYTQWLGYAFERFCRKNHRLVAKKLGFEAVRYKYGTFYNRSTKGYQIDLVFEREDRVTTVCEIKYTETPDTVSVGTKFLQNLALFKPKPSHRIQRVLITVSGATDELRNGGYFDRILDLGDWLSQEEC